MASVDDYKKFITGAIESHREYITVELYHSEFSETLRFVKDRQDATLTLESTAPRDPSSSVLFKAIAMEVNDPTGSGDAEQVLTVKLGAVGGEVNDKYQEITDFTESVQLIYRKFYSGNLTEPVLVLTMYVSDINFESYEKVTIMAEDVNFAVKRAGEIYTIERFAGLKRL